MKIKAMSVNQAWRGGPRYKTKEYLRFWDEMFYKLPPMDIPDGKLRLNMGFGVSNKLSDLDNLFKPVIDILQDTYRFNDRRIYQINACKQDIPKGEEYVSIGIAPYHIINASSE